MTVRRFIRPAALIAAALLSGCGGERLSVPGSAPSASAGQVAPPTATPKATYYAAARFAEQATFGPTPALIEELRSKGSRSGSTSSLRFR